jgi:DNA-binding CsgD family transcriptional regulator
MHKLEARKLEELNRGVRELYAHRTPHGVKGAVLSLIARVIDIDIATVDDVQPDGTVELTTYPSAETPTVNKATPILAEHLPEHPGIPAFLRRDPMPIRMSDFYSLSKYRGTAIYNEVYRPFGVLYQMNAMPPGEALKNSAVTLHRSSRDFTEEDRSILYLLAPHFAQAYLNALAWEQSQSERGLLTNALAAQSQDTVFLDSSHRPCYLSPRAAKWFERYFAAENLYGGLPQTIASWAADARAQRRASLAGSAPRPTLRIEETHARLDVQWFSDEQGREMLLLTEKRSLFAPAGLAQLGLTPREAEVLRWMAEGKTDSEIGIIIGASEHTAHKHAQNILRKLGVSSRATALLRVCELLGAV